MGHSSIWPPARVILARTLCLPGTLWDRRTKTLWDKVYFGDVVRRIGNLKLRRARCDHTCQAGSLLSTNTRSCDSTTCSPKFGIPALYLNPLLTFFSRPIALPSCLRTPILTAVLLFLRLTLVFLGVFLPHSLFSR